MATKKKGGILDSIKNTAKNVKDKIVKSKVISTITPTTALDAKSESERLDTLVFFDNEDMLASLETQGINVVISPLYHVLYGISPKVDNFRVINISKFLASGNTLFIPSDFKDNIELVDKDGEILISFTPGVGSQELLLGKGSNIVGIRRSSKLGGKDNE